MLDATIDQIIGTNVCRLREAAGYTQATFGAALPEPVSSQQISKYERGDNPISTRRIVEFSHLLKAPLLDFFEGIVMLAPATPQSGSDAAKEIRARVADLNELVFASVGQHELVVQYQIGKLDNGTAVIHAHISQEI